MLVVHVVVRRCIVPAKQPMPPKIRGHELEARCPHTVDHDHVDQPEQRDERVQRQEERCQRETIACTTASAG